jgi:hypothetical protein
LKIPNIKRKGGEEAGVMAQGVGPEFKPQYCKKKKKTKKPTFFFLLGVFLNSGPGLVLAIWALYHLNHTLSHVLLLVNSGRSLPRPASDCDLSSCPVPFHVVGIYKPPNLAYRLRWGLGNFLPGLASNRDLLCLQSHT